jgi:hypothetical protein
VITIYIIIPFILVPQLLFSGFTVNYDRLHKIWRNPVYVPVIGDMMTSRWAYEALAVYQFKDNKFSRNFFAEDMIKENASYHRYILDQLKIRLENANFKLQTDSAYDPGEDFNLIRAELMKLSEQGLMEPFPGLDKLNPAQYDQDLYQDVINFLEREKKQLTAIIREAQEHLDAINADMVAKLGGEEAYLKMEDDYYNERLAQLLRNEHFIEAAIVIDNQFVRKKDLIYMEPASRCGRAHFYAPVKKIGSLTIDTYLFNFLFIWMTSFLFYLTLVFDVLRRIVGWTERMKLRKNKHPVR